MARKSYKGTGPDIGSAVLDLIAQFGPRRASPLLKLRYMLSKSRATPLTIRDIAELVGVQPRTVRGWLTGSRPTPASRRRLEDAYGAVWAARHPRIAGAILRLESQPADGISVAHRQRGIYNIGQKNVGRRPWGALLACRTPEDVFDPESIYERTGVLEEFVEVDDGPPVQEDYLWFIGLGRAELRTFTVTVL